MNHTLFISDLHLEAARPDITACFLHFLTTQAVHADALYILGDFFEVWIGDDEVTPLHQTVIDALRQLTARGLPVYFMHGNRDFLIGEAFIQATGCRFLPDPTVIDLYGRKTLLLHGDSLCTDDRAHQTFRKYAQNRAYNRWFLLLPLWLRSWLARRIRSASQRHTAKASYAVMDVSPNAVAEQMRLHQVTQLIHGHTHRPALHALTIDDQPARRIVLGDWHTQGSVLMYPAQGECALLAMALFPSPLVGEGGRTNI